MKHEGQHKAGEIEVADRILHDHNHDGIDRRGFLKCMAWAGTGAFCVMKGGVLSSYGLGGFSDFAKHAAKGDLTFVQISDSHMGFDKAANPDVVSTFKAAIDKINALPDSSGLHSSYGRHQPSLEAGGVRHRRPVVEGSQRQGCVLCSRRARRSE